MLEVLVLILFAGGLIGCVLLDVSVLYALGAGYFLFLLYGHLRGHAWKNLFTSSLQSVLQARNILIVFFLTGILTAYWRAAGTIPVVVCFAAKLIRPSLYLLMTFWLNCLISVLTGTSFGTSATMGVICAAVGRSLGVDIRMIGGAVLAGAFFGDRCSPVSTSALLVAQLSHTDIYRNIPGMIRTARVPFFISSVLYLILGAGFVRGGAVPDIRSLFESSFSLHWSAVLPAAVILLLALKRVNVKLAMAAGIVSAIPLCVFVQHLSPAQLLPIAVFGFRTGDARMAAMINGGGLLSMIRVAGIVCISSGYAGLFRETGLLAGLQGFMERIAARSTGYTAVLLTSLLTAVIACNQTLTIMLTAQMCENLEPDREKFAIDLEDAAVLIPALIPWSIAGGVPLSTVDAPAVSALFAFFLYLLPIWRLIGAGRAGRRTCPHGSAVDQRICPHGSVTKGDVHAGTCD